MDKVVQGKGQIVESWSSGCNSSTKSTLIHTIYDKEIVQRLEEPHRQMLSGTCIGVTLSASKIRGSEDPCPRWSPLLVCSNIEEENNTRPDSDELCVIQMFRAHF